MFKIVKNYETFINSVMIYKSIYARMWYDSPHLFKQFSRIGLALSQALVDSNITSIDTLMNTNPRRLEAILKKNKPFGDHVIETLKNLPKYSISFNKLNDQSDDKCTVDVICSMDNYNCLDENGGHLGSMHPLMFILGDEYQNLLVFAKLK
jgi:ATP-dependent DNA helicase HFM1/MER3